MPEREANAFAVALGRLSLAHVPPACRLGLTNSVRSRCAMAGQALAAGRASSSTTAPGCRRRSSANVFSGLANRSARRGSCSIGSVMTRLGAAGENLDDFVLRPREVGEAVEDDETKGEGRKTKDEGRKHFGFRIFGISDSPFAFRLPLPLASTSRADQNRPSASNRPCSRNALLIGVVDFRQFDVLVADAAAVQASMELLGPDLQPLQLADELAHQIHQSAGRGDRLEMLSAGRGPTAGR